MPNTHEPPNPRPRSPLTIGLLVAILAALVVLIIVVLNRGGDTSQPGGGSSTVVKPVEGQEAPTLPGGARSADTTAASAPKPSKPVDVKRVEATYEPGRTYRTLMNFELNARGTAADWGVETTANIFYVGEMLILRTIESNDGKTLVLTQEFSRAQNMRLATQIDNVSFIRPGVGGTVALLFVDWAGSASMGLTPGWSQDILGASEIITNTPFVKDIMSRVATDQTAKAMAYVDSMQGKRVRITYVNGEGVREVEPLGCELSQQERDFISASSIISDTYVLPDPDCKVGDRWKIQGQDLMPVIDPSLHAHVEGELSASRAPDNADGSAAVVNIDDGGYLELAGHDEKKTYFGRWTPTGKMMFSFKDKIVTDGELGGSFTIESRSTDHWVFEAKFVTQPKYRVQYSCSVVP